eukprot:1150682-Pelagomonas_calceolata.AAC.2
MDQMKGCNALEQTPMDQMKGCNALEQTPMDQVKGCNALEQTPMDQMQGCNVCLSRSYCGPEAHHRKMHMHACTRTSRSYASVYHLGRTWSVQIPQVGQERPIGMGHIPQHACHDLRVCKNLKVCIRA